MINQISNEIKGERKRDEVLLYRGQSNISYDLVPSIAREASTEESFLGYETRMIAKAIGKRPDIFHKDDYPINLLVKLQHYGIPTRLLDVTYNALVALYFACSNTNDFDKDGEVFVFNPTKGEWYNRLKYYDNRDVNTIAQMYTLNGLPEYDIKRFFDDINLEYKRTDYRCEIGSTRYVSSDYYFKDLIRNISIPNFISPVELSERQKRQQGVFMIFPNKIIKHEKNPNQKNSEDRYEITPVITPLNKDNAVVVARIKIPKTSKKDMLKCLENFGINEEFLFPDNIDILCKTIKDVYQKY